MNNTVLIIAAHADDEVLGCAGAIARHVAEGDSVHVAFMADGVTSRVELEKTSVQTRLAAAEKAHAILGVSRVFYLALPDNRMDEQPLLDIVKKIEPIIQDLRPHFIYTHHQGDLNIDHRITHHAVMTACRPVPGCSVREIRCFEVLSSTEWGSPTFVVFQPNLFLDISNYLEKKIAALSAYHFEMRSVPHSRSIAHAEVLARHRGYCVGLLAAEAFVLVRVIS